MSELQWDYEPPCGSYKPVHAYSAKRGSYYFFVMRYRGVRGVYEALASHPKSNTTVGTGGIRGLERAKAWCVAVVPLLEQAMAMRKATGGDR